MRRIYENNTKQHFYIKMRVKRKNEYKNLTCVIYCKGDKLNVGKAPSTLSFSE